MKNTIKKNLLRWFGLLFVLSVIVVSLVIINKTNRQTSQITASYDLRDYGLITSAKNQNGEKADGTSDVGTTVGLCWAFSALSSLESNMLKQGITASPNDENANLSPWYLGNYIGYNHPYYQFNDDTFPDVEPATAFGYLSKNFLGWGGDAGSFWVADYLLSGKELPLWKDSPMPTQDMSAQKTLTKPQTNATKKYILKDMDLLYAEDSSDKKEYRTRIKQYILKNGAVQSFVHLEVIDIEGINKQTCQGVVYTGHRFMDKVNHNLYTYETDKLCTALYTHAVTIAGWDDSRKINIDGHETTGAWLIKDSQGDNAHDHGYFWVAYDDKVFLDFFASGLIAEKSAAYQHPSVYQTHNGGLSKISPEEKFAENSMIELGSYSYLLNGIEGKDSWGFAKFNLTKDEKLKAVALFTGNPYEKVTINVYKNSEKSGVLLSKEFDIAEIGYHLLDLGKEISFSAQDTIVIGAGFKYNINQKRLPLVYVRDNNYSFKFPTYYAALDGGIFRLTPYSDLCKDCSFFMQAVMAL